MLNATAGFVKGESRWRPDTLASVVRESRIAAFKTVAGGSGPTVPSADCELYGEPMLRRSLSLRTRLRYSVRSHHMTGMAYAEERRDPNLPLEHGSRGPGQSRLSVTVRMGSK